MPQWTADAPRPGRLRARLRRAALPAAVFVACTLFMVGPHVLPPTQLPLVVYEPLDGYAFVWNFWWTEQAVAVPSNPYWTNRLSHPHGTSLAYYSYPLSYSLLALPVQWLAPGPDGRVLALNAIILLSFFAAGFGAYRLAAYATGSRRAALVAGLSYTFVPYHFLIMGNLHLLAIELLPFYVLALLRLAARPSARRAAAVGVWMSLALYTSLEYALYLALYSGLWLVGSISWRRRRVTRRFVAFVGLAVVGFLVLSAPLLVQLAAAAAPAAGQPERDLVEVRVWSPALAALFVPSRVNALWGDAFAFLGDYGRAVPGTWSMRSDASLSLLNLLLAMVAWRLSKARGRGLWALGAATFIVLALGPFLRLTGTWITEVPLPYLALYELVPPMRAGRDPVRLLPLGMLLLSVTAAFGTRALLQRAGGRRARLALTLLLCGAALLEGLVQRRGTFRPYVPAVYHELAEQTDDFAILDLSPDERERMLFQTVHGKRLTGLPRIMPRAQVGSLPRVEAEFWRPGLVLDLPPDERAERLAAARKELRALDFRHAVLPNDAQAVRRVALAQQLGANVRLVEDRLLCTFVPWPATP